MTEGIRQGRRSKEAARGDSKGELGGLGSCTARGWGLGNKGAPGAEGLQRERGCIPRRSIVELGL